MNGSLLALAENHGFEVFLTADQNIGPQQNLRGRNLAIVVLSINKYHLHRARIASISFAIENCTPGTVTLVNLDQADSPRLV